MSETERPRAFSDRDPGGDDLEVHLVPLRRRHLRSVLRIEGQVYPKPWSFSLFMSELNLRSTRHYVAARVGGLLVGYGGLMYVADEGHVTNIAVDPVWHRHQIGTRLLANLVEAARARGARHMTLEVRVSNTPAQAMYRRFGFVTEGVRKNYYEQKEDALIMWSHDIHTPAYDTLLAGIVEGIQGTTVDET